MCYFCTTSNTNQNCKDNFFFFQTSFKEQVVQQQTCAITWASAGHSIKLQIHLVPISVKTTHFTFIKPLSLLG